MKKFLTYSPKYDYLTAEEEELLNEDVALIEKAVSVSHKLNKKRIATRNAHAKAFGFVRGNFIPADNKAADFPKLLKGSNLGVIIRYSHPNFFVTKGGGEYPLYGCAVKIYNKNIPVSAKFPLVNLPVFITNSVSKFLKLHIKANQFFISRGTPFSLSFLKVPGLLKSALILFFDREILPILNNTVKVLDIEKHLINGYNYHSVGCFRLEDRIVKIRLKPSGNEKFKPDADIDQADALKVWFLKNDLALDFQVQLATDKKKTPVNNLLKQWKEKHSEFITVGKIILPKQDISQYGSIDYENLSFNPFENPEALLPVGRMQKIRQQIYNKSVATRQSLNRIQ
ncbi:hypothetical protein [Kaistella faecalis]|uniref:hypothetical protein n=1 Tax=Kaistella faecalis TaxID=2852098 RepID=UPI001C493C4F|nr:hypothetical protein [Chryseobacterium faecale]UFK98513.1 hypothetical protein LL667_03940 [Chryseobacterium faecale]